MVCLTHFLQANTISWLAEHKFDFNKLFNGAVTYNRESEFEKLADKSLYEITKSHPSLRTYSELSHENQSKLVKLMNQADKFVWDTTSEQTKEFKVASYCLKKALDKQIKKKYMKTGVFLNYKHNDNKVVLRKSRGFK